MKLRIRMTLFLVSTAQFAWGQTSTKPRLVIAEATAPEPSANSYDQADRVIGAVLHFPDREILREKKVR